MKLPRKIILIVFLLSSNLAIAAESLPYELIAYMKSLDIKYEPIDKSDLSEDMIDDHKRFRLSMISMVMVATIMPYC